MKTHFTWLMAMLCLSVLNVKAQDSTDHLSADQSLSLSLLLEQANDYPGIQALDQVIKQATIDQQLTRQEGLPQFDVQAQNSYGTYTGLAGASFPLPGSYNVSGTNSSTDQAINMQISGILRWDLLQFGKLQNKINAAALKTRGAQKEQEMGIWRYKYELSRRFMALIYHEQMIKWTEKDLQRQHQLIALTNALATSGMVAGADTLLSLSRYHQSEAAKERWQGMLQSSYSQLKKLTPALPGTLQALPSLFARLPQQSELQQGTDNTSNHPLIQVKKPAILLTEVQQLGLDKSVLPNISVLAAGQLRGFAPGRESLQAAYGLPARNYLAGIALTWKLAPLYQKSNLQRKYQFQKYQLEAEQKTLQLDLQAQHDAAKQQLVQAAKQIGQFEQSVEMATEAYKLYQIRYQSGLIDLATLLQVQQTLQDAEKQRLIAYYAYWNYLTGYAAAVNDFSLLTRIFH